MLYKYYCIEQFVKIYVIIKYNVSELEPSHYQIRIIIYFQFYREKSITECHQIMHRALEITVVSYDFAKVRYST